VRDYGLEDQDRTKTAIRSADRNASACFLEQFRGVFGHKMGAPVVRLEPMKTLTGSSVSQVEEVAKDSLSFPGSSHDRRLHPLV